MLMAFGQTKLHLSESYNGLRYSNSITYKPAYKENCKKTGKPYLLFKFGSKDFDHNIIEVTTFIAPAVQCYAA